MKITKTVFLNTLTLLFGIGLMADSFSPREAQAAATETVPKMEVQKLGNFKGQYLTVFYAVGTRPFIATDSSQFTLSEVKAIKTERIAEDLVTFPAIELQKQGFRPGYNLVVMVISPEANVSLTNANGAPIEGMPQTDNRRTSLVRSFSKSDIEALLGGADIHKGVVLTLQ